MSIDLPYQLLADAVLILHVGIAAFIVGGVVLILIGNLRRWHWVNILWFRLAHLGAIAMVTLETWLEIACPLTVLEMWLRAKAHAATYEGGFIEYWLQRLLYYDIPPWIFLAAYSLFTLLVAALWYWFPPASSKTSSSTTAHRATQRAAKGLPSNSRSERL